LAQCLTTAYPDYSRKAFCKACNNTIIAKHCELKRRAGRWKEKALR